ncbi:hypothetical protein POTOM_041349 [Populus tomentosa]|uniref:Uncharacterized protein n=1 Tax=Populus tomentosa TaxID=118781 RepID=A0A8X7YMF1_POPTO|nr:hypothetical protein POTOM_041349 [Populus tomentosa]
MSCSFWLIPTRFPTLSSYNKDIISATLPGFSSFSCLRNGRRSNSSATCISKRRRLGCKCQLADLAPVTSAAYGVILLGGGLFAFGKSGSKGSLFGGLTGAALMGTDKLAEQGIQVDVQSRLNSAFGSAEDSNEFVSIPGLFLSKYIVAVAALLKMLCGDGFDFCRRFGAKLEWPLLSNYIVEQTYLGSF